MQIEFNPALFRTQNLLKIWQSINGLIEQRTPKGLEVWCTRIMMKRVCTPIAAHRRWLSKGVIDTVSWLSQSTDSFTKFNEANLQLRGNGVNLIKAKSAIFTVLSKFNALQRKSSPSWTLTVSKPLTLKVSVC